MNLYETWIYYDFPAPPTASDSQVVFCFEKERENIQIIFPAEAGASLEGTDYAKFQTCHVCLRWK